MKVETTDGKVRDHPGAIGGVWGNALYIRDGVDYKLVACYSLHNVIWWGTNASRCSVAYGPRRPPSPRPSTGKEEHG